MTRYIRYSRHSYLYSPNVSYIRRSSFIKKTSILDFYSVIMLVSFHIFLIRSILRFVRSKREFGRTTLLSDIRKKLMYILSYKRKILLGRLSVLNDFVDANVLGATLPKKKVYVFLNRWIKLVKRPKLFTRTIRVINRSLNRIFVRKRRVITKEFLFSRVLKFPTGIVFREMDGSYQPDSMSYQLLLYWSYLCSIINSNHLTNKFMLLNRIISYSYEPASVKSSYL